MIDESLRALDDAGVPVRAIENEIFSIARALLPYGSTETVLIIDIGRTTTKFIVAVRPDTALRDHARYLAAMRLR